MVKWIGYLVAEAIFEPWEPLRRAKGFFDFFYHEHLDQPIDRRYCPQGSVLF